MTTGTGCSRSTAGSAELSLSLRGMFPVSDYNLEERGGKSDLALLETGAWASCRLKSENYNKCRYFCHMPLLTSASGVTSTSRLSATLVYNDVATGAKTNDEVKSKLKAVVH